MTNSEFKQLVANSTSPDKCENLNLDFYYATQPGYERKTGLTTIYEYVKRERNSWKRVKDDMPNLLRNSFQHFESLLKRIEKFATNYLHHDDRNFNNQWRRR